MTDSHHEVLCPHCRNIINLQVEIFPTATGAAAIVRADPELNNVDEEDPPREGPDIHLRKGG